MAIPVPPPSPPANPKTLNLSSIQQVASGANAAASLASLLIATPTNVSQTTGYQPVVAPSTGLDTLIHTQPPSLLFHYEAEQTMTFESDITDHYVEDNTSRQDQISLKPEIVTTNGFIGELNNVPSGILSQLLTVANSLVSVSAYAPALSTTSLLAYDLAFAAYQTAQSIENSAVSAWSSLTSAVGAQDNQIGDTGAFKVGNGQLQNKQQQMLQSLYGYWNSRTLFNIQTPWCILTNMAIMSVKAVQEEETNVISNYQVSFKKIRVATQSVGFTQVLAGRADTQSAPNTQLGTGPGSEDGTTLGQNIQTT